MTDSNIFSTLERATLRKSLARTQILRKNKASGWSRSQPNFSNKFLLYCLPICDEKGSVSEQPKILVVDDEESMCHFMEIMLNKEGYQVETAGSGPEAISSIEKSPPDLVIADMMMPEMTGLELLTKAKARHAALPFIMMTAFASVDSAVEALKKGAEDYITKPFKIDEIKHVIKKAFEKEQMRSENAELRNLLEGRVSLDDFLGDSDVVSELKELVRQIAQSDSTVLILGESGTGKDLIAQAIHTHSRRAEEAFVAINCGAIPELLLESELFGHVKGSFTGAISDKDGQLKMADGGVLFLDEIGNLSSPLQVKLLRALETQEFTPVGAVKPVKVDVRLIAATNADLEAEVKANRFRADLFYRLNVLPVALPSLAERRGDILLLAGHFLRRVAAKHDAVAKSLSDEAERLIVAYDWPGNVRELENTITRACLLSKKPVITPKDFPKQVSQAATGEVVSAEPSANPTLESIEKAYVFWVLEQTAWKKSKAAKLLGIDASTLYRKIDRYGLKKSSS
jgi:DNA-binding NtrC family response regulator